MVDYAALAFAFSAGSAAFLNPCGVGLLPAYISYYVEKNEHHTSRFRRGLDGLFLGLLVSLGFLLVFVLAGILFLLVSEQVLVYGPYLSISVGSFVILFGIAMLFNKSVGIRFLSQIGMRLKRVKTRSNVLTFFIFGIGYALASLACTIPLFLVVVASSFTAGLAEGILSFLAYGFGMSFFMIVVSVGVGTAKELFQKLIMQYMREFQIVSALIIIVAGSYVVWNQVAALLL